LAFLKSPRRNRPANPRLYGLSLAFIATLSMQFGQQRIERS
jgi:hypothetical protein